jgi:hypothetical protein
MYFNKLFRNKFLSRYVLIEQKTHLIHLENETSEVINFENVKAYMYFSSLYALIT